MFEEAIEVETGPELVTIAQSLMQLRKVGYLARTNGMRVSYGRSTLRSRSKRHQREKRPI
jgi:hypothetical protein